MERCEPEKGHGQLFRRGWILPAAIIALIAVHGIVLQYVMSHLALSTAAIAGVIVVVAIKHIGLLGPAYAWLRRYFRRERR
jgi:membrane protein YdbS with pleckstrin-like domain